MILQQRLAWPHKLPGVDYLPPRGQLAC
jgi:hypothetical protein